MAKPLLEDKKARDKFAQQAGFKDYNDLAEQYKKDPNTWTASKGKITGDESYTPEQIQNYIEQDIMNRKGNKSAPTPSEDYNKAVAENFSQEELAGKKGLEEAKDLQVGSIADVNPVDAAIGRIRAGEATDEDLKLAFESGYEGGEATQKAYQELGLTKGIPTENEEIVNVMEEAEDIAKPKAYDTKEEKTAKKAYNKATASIWDAYYNGDFGLDENGNPTEEAKSIATYFTIDAIAKLAGNLGKRIGNVGAQFTGGTIDNNFETSDWENRRDQLLNEANQMQAEELGGPAARKAEADRLANEGAALGNVSQEIQNQVASIRANYTDEQIRQQIAMMDKQLEQMGLNIENMEDARTFVETLKQKPENERTWLDNLMIAWMSQSGVNAAVNAGGSGIGSLIGLLAK